MLSLRSVSTAALLALATAAWASPSAAESYPTMAERSGPYIGLRAVGGFTILDDIKQKGTEPAKPSNDSHLDHTAGPALAGGYQFEVPGGGLQVELEYTFRWRYDYDDARPVLNGGAPVASNDGLTSDVQTNTALVNFRYLMNFGGNLYPYVMAGIGASHHKAENESTRLGAPGPGQLDDTTTQINLTWTAGVGVEYDITRRLGLSLAYRYTDLGSVDLGTFQHASGGTIHLEGDFISHDLLLGLLYRF